MIAKANDIPPTIVPKASNERALGSVPSGNSSYSERAAAIKNEEKKKGVQMAEHTGKGDKTHKDKVTVYCEITGDVLHIEVRDKGKGIEDINKAMEALYTTKPELERSGMGFAFMEAFMDDLEVESQPGAGTKVSMKKKIGSAPWIADED